MLHYQIKPKSLGGHLLAATITIPAGEQSITAKLPKWIPGSYKIRDYSRHIQAFAATAANGQPLAWKKTDSDTWVIAAEGQVVTLTYEVYAYDLSVRGAYLDDTRLFFNHCCVFFDIIHLSSEKRTIDIETVGDWRIFTALGSENGHYIADSYEHQMDCPVESAENYHHSEFDAGGVRHEVIFTGSLSADDDMDGMTQHLKNICEAEIRLFGGSPLDKYLFMTYLEANQYGGLEHKNSVAQIAAPNMMMRKGQPLNKAMIDFMGLCSHEYFHLWNVKRLQPKDFKPYDLYREQHTEMLWMFEGFTSYYDELFLLRAGVVDAKTFLQRQADNLSRVLNVPGRLLQPLAASSFDAWTKLYQADANSPNNMVSYYSKGAVFALYLDLFIRQHSQEGKSLDDVMRYLWKNFAEQDTGIDENDVFAACCQQLPSQQHKALAQLFVDGLHATDDLDFSDLLADFGVTVSATVARTNNQPHRSEAGLRLSITNQKATIAFLDATSHAAKVGVSVGDELIAIDQEMLSLADFNHCLQFGEVGQSLQLTLARRGRVFEKSICLTKPSSCQIQFSLSGETALGNAWLAVWRECYSLSN